MMASHGKLSKAIMKRLSGDPDPDRPIKMGSAELAYYLENGLFVPPSDYKDSTTDPLARNPKRCLRESNVGACIDLNMLRDVIEKLLIPIDTNTLTSVASAEAVLLDAKNINKYDSCPYKGGSAANILLTRHLKPFSTRYNLIDLSTSNNAPFVQTTDTSVPIAISMTDLITALGSLSFMYPTRVFSHMEYADLVTYYSTNGPGFNSMAPCFRAIRDNLTKYATINGVGSEFLAPRKEFDRFLRTMSKEGSDVDHNRSTSNLLDIVPSSSVFCDSSPTNECEYFSLVVGVDPPGDDDGSSGHWIALVVDARPLDQKDWIVSVCDPASGDSVIERIGLGPDGMSVADDPADQCSCLVRQVARSYLVLLEYGTQLLRIKSGDDDLMPIHHIWGPRVQSMESTNCGWVALHYAVSCGIHQYTCIDFEQADSSKPSTEENPVLFDNPNMIWRNYFISPSKCNINKAIS